MTHETTHTEAMTATRTAEFDERMISCMKARERSAIGNTLHRPDGKTAFPEPLTAGEGENSSKPPQHKHSKKIVVTESKKIRAGAKVRETTWGAKKLLAGKSVKMPHRPAKSFHEQPHSHARAPRLHTKMCEVCAGERKGMNGNGSIRIWIVEQIRIRRIVGNSRHKVSPYASALEVRRA
jgi:hypothetical protein